MNFRLSSLNIFHASMRRNPHSSSYESSYQRTRIAWITLSIPASTPTANCAFSQVAFVSCPVTRRRHFTINLSHVSPTLTGLIPSCLSSAINRPLINALYAVNGGGAHCPAIPWSRQKSASALHLPPRVASVINWPSPSRPAQTRPRVAPLHRVICNFYRYQLRWLVQVWI